MSLAQRLTNAMAIKGISQAELARACNVKPPSVHGWLSGKAKFLRGENLLLAAAALGVSQQWLATGEGAMQADAGEDLAQAGLPVLQPQLAYDMPYNAGSKKKDDEDFDQYWERKDKERVKYGEAEYNKHKEFFENNHVYILSYADDEGEAELEHGNIFRNLPFSMAVSYH